MNNFDKEIEAYLNDEMTSDERASFEASLKESQVMREQFEVYKEMHTIYNDADWELADKRSNHGIVRAHERFLQSEEGRNLTNSIKNAGNSYFEEKSGSNVKRILMYAGAVAAMLIAIAIVILKNGSIDEQQLYASYKNWDDLPSLTNRDGNSDLSEGESLFQNGRYEEAQKIFESLQEDPNYSSPELLLYIGAIQLELNKDEDALKTFKELADSNALDAPKARWYLALAYLKGNQKEKAAAELELLIKNEGFKYSEAKKLLRELE